MKTEFILWDFGDTLVDQDWMLRAPESFPNGLETRGSVARG